ncbi:MAG TPA: Ig-like domain-containing protein, partial [Planctomycetaceae bacterium]|nr:Ig-like domain-containing protein [Planctomycetaceae bacterium]
VLANDSQARNGQRQAHLMTGPSHGQLALQADGSFRYTPAAGWVGFDSFSYEVRAYSQASDPATVTLRIEAPRFTLSGNRLEAHLRTASEFGFANDGGRFRAFIREDGQTFEQPLSNANRSAIQTVLIVGSNGDDHFDLSQLNAARLPNLSHISVQGGDGNDTIFGSEFADVIQGGAGNDSIESALGNDTILGGEGDDEVDAGDGNDSVEAGAGDDSLYGNDGNDTLVGQAGMDILAVSIGKDVLRGSRTSVVAVGGDVDWVLTNTSAKATYVDGRRRVTITNTLQGTFGGAIIVGGDGDNKYTATGFRFGNVTATGGAGNDTIYGSPGNDFILGEDGNDRIDGGGGNDGLEGADGNDTLLGSTGDDTLLGDSGKDSLNGGAGRDSLGGG